MEESLETFQALDPIVSLKPIFMLTDCDDWLVNNNWEFETFLHILILSLILILILHLLLTTDTHIIKGLLVQIHKFQHTAILTSTSHNTTHQPPTIHPLPPHPRILPRHPRRNPSPMRHHPLHRNPRTEPTHQRRNRRLGPIQSAVGQTVQSLWENRPRWFGRECHFLFS